MKNYIYSLSLYKKSYTNNLSLYLVKNRPVSTKKEVVKNRPEKTWAPKVKCPIRAEVIPTFWVGLLSLFIKLDQTLKVSCCFEFVAMTRK